jgi:hypothetical protein
VIGMATMVCRSSFDSGPDIKKRTKQPRIQDDLLDGKTFPSTACPLWPPGSKTGWKPPQVGHLLKINLSTEARHSRPPSSIALEHRLEAYATLFSGLSGDLSEPSRELLPGTRRNDATG